jgi:hypothetical protein
MIVVKREPTEGYIEIRAHRKVWYVSRVPVSPREVSDFLYQTGPYGEVK